MLFWHWKKPVKKLIKAQIDKHFNHMYFVNNQILEDALPMLGFDIWLACQNLSVSECNANQLLEGYIKYLDGYFLYLNHEFFRCFASLKLAHYKLFFSNYCYEQFQKLHAKYASQADYTKEMLIRAATHKIDAISQLYDREVH